MRTKIRLLMGTTDLSWARFACFSHSRSNTPIPEGVGGLSEQWNGRSKTSPDGQDEGIVSHDFFGLTDGFLQQKLSVLESQKVAFCFGSCHSCGMFDDDLQGANRVTASACRADEYAWHYLLLGTALWGNYFVDEGLLQGLADPQSDDSIEETHACAYLKVTDERPDSYPRLHDQYAGELIL